MSFGAKLAPHEQPLVALGFSLNKKNCKFYNLYIIRKNCTVIRNADRIKSSTNSSLAPRMNSKDVLAIHLYFIKVSGKIVAEIPYKNHLKIMAHSIYVFRGVKIRFYRNMSESKSTKLVKMTIFQFHIIWVILILTKGP